MMDAMNVRNKSALQKAKGKKRSRTHPEEDVDFRSDVLPVTCGDAKGMLHKNKLSQRGTVKSIMKEDGKWFTPREFEVEGGHKNSSNWKQSVHCGGKTLKWLMEEGFLPQPPTTHGRKKQKNSDVCEICQDGGKLFCCDTCLKSFHEDCHIPRVETERSPRSCTFCRRSVFRKSGVSQGI
ncbi:PREDICTED: nuclear body protein SP140-like protein isoform X1 [Hipposideros armiger]|uniref:Nuclear body protein SP140-like protein isoform X1 n=1 Tax=Hipposideros armiger TaxID=186990 RepID=A0A8B7QPT3_HIPAR|nr:PREDICTED: nuclear body protein SP140-like protein isoform X1 [Hipposideros armiger]